MISSTESRRAIAAIHYAISSVRPDKFVFIGGGIVPLLITDQSATPCRPTKDVDVVFEITTASDYVFARTDLLRAGFTDDATREKPACALFYNEWRVDLLPTRPNIVQGGGNRWFPDVVASAEVMEIDGEAPWLATAPAFIATKLEAWTNRGRMPSGAPDYFHHDLEDIVAVMDGRPEASEEAAAASPAVRHFLQQSFTSLLSSTDFLNAIPGHTGGNEIRARIVLDRIRQIISL